MESGLRGCLRRFQIGDSRGRQAIGGGTGLRTQRNTRYFLGKGSKVIMLKRIGVGLLAIIVYAICLEAGERLEVPGVHSFVSTAEAIIGRPLTPMSYAGIARRTARRCAAGVYYC